MTPKPRSADGLGAAGRVGPGSWRRVIGCSAAVSGGAPLPASPDLVLRRAELVLRQARWTGWISHTQGAAGQGAADGDEQSRRACSAPSCSASLRLPQGFEIVIYLQGLRERFGSSSCSRASSSACCSPRPSRGPTVSLTSACPRRDGYHPGAMVVVVLWVMVGVEVNEMHSPACDRRDRRVSGREQSRGGGTVAGVTSSRPGSDLEAGARSPAPYSASYANTGESASRGVAERVAADRVGRAGRTAAPPRRS